MQDASVNAKQQIVERIKQSTNILVTVSNNPSVDALSAALGFTLMLNKLDKHATAVFSGVIPPAIKFLEPTKTFESNVDSLRDFIIALDKEKADRLRYKVEDDVVKIFITPYRTTITDKDLQFSQGDFNVDLIVALGVEKREELDKAITAHGRILHDAAVVTVNAANQKSSLGAIDWNDGAASSLCEMLMSLSEALQPNILDQQISTALLTGIVAATERFSNQHTTPRVMTMSAQLMAAGANQQLIATNLRAASAMASNVVSSPSQGSAKVKAAQPEEKAPGGEMHIKHDAAPKAPAQAKPAQPTPAAAELDIPTAAPAAAGFNDLKQALEQETEATTSQPTSKPTSVESAATTPDKATINATQPTKAPVEKKGKDDDGYITDKPSWMGRNIEPPTLGGTLSATAEEALESKMHQEEDERNHKILTHGESPPSKKKGRGRKSERVVQPPAEPAPAPAAAQQPAQAPIATPAPNPMPASTPEPSLPPVAPPPAQPSEPAPATPPAPSSPAPAGESLMDAMPLQTEPSIEQLEQEAKNHSDQNKPGEADLDAARQAVNEALAAQPFNPAGQPLESVGAQEFNALPAAAAPAPTAVTLPPAPAQPEPLPQPTIPQVPQMPQQPPAMAQPTIPQQPQPMPLPQPQQPAPAGLPPVPPLPDFSTLPPPPSVPQLPPLPESPLDQPQQPNTPQQPPQPPATNDPKQFKIPGA